MSRGEDVIVYLRTFHPQAFTNLKHDHHHTLSLFAIKKRVLEESP